MRKTHLAFLWHMHQPDYVDPTSRRALLPWVRLHAARAYYDVAALLHEYPHVHLTVNFVPSLVRQLHEVANGAVDVWQEIATREHWDAADRLFLLERFFSVHWARCIDSRPRYRELLDKRGRTIVPGTLAARAAEFTEAELRDLTVLFSLAWIGFAARKLAPEIDALEKKGRDFDAADLATVLALQRRIAGEVLPLYTQLEARGQIELSASPLCHPIAPLVIDSEHAHRAMPGATLPPRYAYPEDAAAQIVGAVERHRATFGRLPEGMWPPEGSVSPEAVSLYRQAGVKWLATDEGNLWRSVRQGDPLMAGDLFRAHRFDGVQLVFRERELSDRIGFSYATMDPGHAVDDLIGRVRASADHSRAPDGEAALVAVILDGENPWEAYPDNGQPFLRRLFERLGEEQARGELESSTISAHLAAAPASSTLTHLHSGSWIDSDFHIWIADPVKNRAWALLGEARRAWREAKESNSVDSDALTRALVSVWSAEGSDWFWWFGEPFHSAEDALFDRLFRAHLAGVYQALGRPVPSVLSQPVDGKPSANLLAPPWALISPQLRPDGQATFYEWQGAGSYVVPRGAVMARVPRTETVWLGFDRAKLYVRLDPHPTYGPFAADSRIELEAHNLVTDTAVRVRGQRGSWEAFDASADADASGKMRLGSGGPLPSAHTLQIAVPFTTLRLAAGQRFELVVRLSASEADRAEERYPAEGDSGFVLTVPDDQFSLQHWSA